MSRRKKAKKIESRGGNWLTTFSDLMSLLLTFFILLFSISSVSSEKFSVASASLQGALIGESGGGAILNGNGISQESTGSGNSKELDAGAMANQNTIPEQVTKMYEEALKIIEKEGIGEQINVRSDQDGVYLDIQESILFDSGKATISNIGKETLASLGDLLVLSDNDIIVEGFTDDVPIGRANYTTNWELSADRAMGVVRFLAEQRRIDPSRLSGRGYGEFNPVAPNDTPQNRAKNRRVNIVLVYKPGEEDNRE